jgi:hypothetical protein
VNTPLPVPSIPLDLHICLEKYQAGAWNPVDDIELIEDVDGELFPDYPELILREKHDLFKFLAGIEVRDAQSRYPIEITPISALRGLPEDMNAYLQQFARAYNSPIQSWLTLQEIQDGIDTLEHQLRHSIDPHNKKYPTTYAEFEPDFQEILQQMRVLALDTADSNVRIVFWFD